MPSFVASTTAHVSTGFVASVTVTAPTGSTGDTLVAVLYGNDLGSPTAIGFVEILNTGRFGSEGQIWIARRERTGAEPASYTFNLTAGSFVAASVLDYSGLTDWIIDAIDHAIGSSGSTVLAPDLTLVGTTDLYLAAYASFDGRTVSADPTGLTLEASDIVVGSQGLTVYDKTLTSGGLVAGQSQTLSSSDAHMSVAFAFKPKPLSWQRTRGWSTTTATRVPSGIPTGPGYEINGRTRGWEAVAVVMPAPDLTPPLLLSYRPVFPVPYMKNGQPYETSALDPWSPTSEGRGYWGRFNVVIDGKNVTSFRTNADGTPIFTHVQNWTDKSPGGDDLLDLWFPAITSRDTLGSGSLSWLAADRHVTLRRIHPNNITIDTLFEGVVGPVEDRISDQSTTGDPSSRLIVHCVGTWADLDRFITLPRPSIDQWIKPIPNGHLTPVDPGQLLYAQIRRAAIYGWSGKMRRPAPTGLDKTGEQCSYGVPIASQTVQSILATMQTASIRKTIVNVRPRGLKLDDLAWDGTGFDFSLHCMQPGVTHDLTLDPAQAYNAIYGHGQAPFGPVDSAIGRPDAVADWMNWQYPIAAFDPPAYPLPVGQDFFAGDGHTGFLPFSNELRAHGYDLDSQDSYLSSDFDLIETFQGNSGAQVDGIVGPQTWGQAFQISINSKALAQSYIKELVAGNAQMPYLLNSRGGFLKPNPLFDPLHHPRREVMEEFGPLAKRRAVQSAKDEIKRTRTPIYRGTVTAKNVDPPEMSSLSTRSGMSMKLKGHAGHDRILFVAQVERIPGMQPTAEDRSVTWTVSEQPEGLMTLAARLQRKLGVKDLIASNRPPRHHAKQIQSYPTFDSESGAGIFLPGQGQTGGLWSKFLIPMGGQVNVDFVKIVASTPTRMAAAVFANPYLTIDQLADIIPNPSVGSTDPWAANATTLENLGICWATGNPTAMQGYWPNDPSTGPETGVLADFASWQFRANSTYGALFVWTDADCLVNGDRTAQYRAFFPEPV